MEKDIFEIIKSGNIKLSKGHRSIAAYITDHFDKAAFMTASKLGKTVGVSESTVVRFATELGFDGYPSLQRALQERMRNKLTAAQRAEVTNDQISENEVLEKVLNLDIDKIRRTLEGISKNDFNMAVESIINSQSIYIIGTRSSSSIASFLAYNFNLIFPNVKFLHTSIESEVFEHLIKISEKDCIIGISFPRYSRLTLEALAYAKNANAKVIAITDSMASPLTQYADHILIAKSDMASFVDSLVAPLSLINALIVAVSMKNKESVSKNLETLEHIWDKYDVYEGKHDRIEKSDE